MFRQVLAATGAITLATLAAGAAQASDGCGPGLYNHNGSTVSIDFCDSVIRYVQPRSTMRRQGVGRGTVLFQGGGGRNGRISGTAYVFKSGCGAAGYRVSGSWRGNSLVLVGNAPVRGSTCRVTRYRRDVLRFN